MQEKNGLSSSLNSSGKIYIDQGAAKALLMNGKSLLAAGINKIEGILKR